MATDVEFRNALETATAETHDVATVMNRSHWWIN
jgi:hypothetical protein